MTWKRDLGLQLQRARKASGLTQAALAARLNVSRQMIGRYEAGRAAPAVEVLAEAAAVLDAEFQILGLRMNIQETAARSTLRALPKQLNLEFNRSTSYRHAVVKITPHRGRIRITADIPA